MLLFLGVSLCTDPPPLHTKSTNLNHQQLEQHPAYTHTICRSIKVGKTNSTSMNPMEKIHLPVKLWNEITLLYVSINIY